VATQNRNIYTDDQFKALRQEFEGTSFGDHVSAVMDAATDDVKSVVEAVIETPVTVFGFLERGGGYFIAGFITGMAAMVIARLL
jgi:hypothetical protein